MWFFYLEIKHYEINKIECKIPCNRCNDSKRPADGSTRSLVTFGLIYFINSEKLPTSSQKLKNIPILF